MKRVSIFLSLLVAIAIFASTVNAQETLRCASTTSTQNSGLFDTLLPAFEKDSGIQVHVVAVGTGAALQLGKRGDVDVVFVHAKNVELKMVEEGHFVGRKDVMYNDFVLVGPKTDPAGLREAKSATEALVNIEEKMSPFVSRGDDSGTHKKEKSLWKTAGAIPQAAMDRWYLSVGQGMAKTIRIAAEKQAYTMTDRGTWLAMADQEKLGLAIAYEGDKVLFNQYGVMAVNPVRHSHVKYDAAQRFITWLTTDRGQQVIDDFRNKKGDQLFVANAVQQRTMAQGK